MPDTPASAPAKPVAAPVAVPAAAPVARPAVARKASSRNGKAASVAASPSTTSRGVAGILAGALLATMMLLMLGGLAYLLWANLHAERPAETAPAPVVAQGPTPQPEPDRHVQPPVENPPKKDSNDTPAKAAGPAKKDDEIDVADLKKKEQPAPAPIAPAPVSPAPVSPAPVPPPPIKLPDGEPATKPPTVEVKVTPPAAYEAARVNAAVDKGIAYLRSKQLPDGSWDYAHKVGATALAGLTLLECKVPARDPDVQRAALYVRRNLRMLFQTYDMSCAVLFLDRLNDPADRVLIQGLALRLLAGQTDSGGWTYTSPLYGIADLRSLNAFLQSRRPAPPPPRKDKAGGDIMDNPVPAQAAFLQGPGAFGAMPPGTAKMANMIGAPFPGGAPQLPNPITSPYRPTGRPPAAANRNKVQPMALGQLPGYLQQLSIVRGTMNQGHLAAQRAGGDHSNTQFALLALWAARRHNIPVEYALLLSYQRFKLGQATDGGWGYKMGEPSSDSMTCAGLLALTLGQGALPSDGKDKVDDPAIGIGLRTLGRSIGTAPDDPTTKVPLPPLYFLWSVERVGVLYGLNTIGGKDWYRWGAQALLVNQKDDGSWASGEYTGSDNLIDTCFALLFLKRANLVPDLTENLRLFMVIRDPGAR